MVPVIICGGVGTKMWPESRKNSPKHFLQLFNGKSLFELNWEALRTKFKAEEIYLQTNATQAKLAQKLVPEIVSANIFIEPETRNQGPATGFTAAMLYKTHPNEPFMLVQADVLRTPAAQFISMVEVCDRLAKETGKYITGGFKPNYPVMGVDYLVPGTRVSKPDEVGVFSVAQFLWRGTREQAEEYVTTKGALIHANHSCTTPRALLEMFKEYKPEWYEPLMSIINGGSVADEYAKMPIGPIEDVTQLVHKAGNSLVVELPFDWTDVGTWESLMNYTHPKEHKNAGNTIEIDATENFIRVPKNKQVALVGVKDLIVVDTDDALLICHKNHTGSVGKIVDTLKENGKHELL
jgi:mannose-1-phosphate guanylyltransferase